MVDITQLLPTDIYQAAVDPSGLRTVANAANPFATVADALTLGKAKQINRNF
jgi:hypothetical protein